MSLDKLILSLCTQRCYTSTDMDTLIKSDVFFFITSIAVIVLGALIGAATVYLIRILRDVKAISERVKEETTATADDFREVRSHLKAQGLGFAALSKLKKLFRMDRKGRSSHTKNTRNG